MVATICCWEVAKVVGKECCVGCWYLMYTLWDFVLSRCQRERVRVVHYVDDVAVIGPRRLLERHLEDTLRETEVVSAPEGPGPLSPRRTTRRRRGAAREFQFVPAVFDDWPSTLTPNFQLVGQDRYELSLDRRTVIRWHVSPRVRLFVPEGTRPPVALATLTGRRRTYLIEASAGGTRSRRYHADDWRLGNDPQGYVPFQWVGCTELEVAEPE